MRSRLRLILTLDGHPSTWDGFFLFFFNNQRDPNGFKRRPTFGIQRKSSVGSICESTETLTDDSKDLIFVHGLGGGSRKTWSKTSLESHFWPKEWLPQDPDFKDVRIHSFGYKSDWVERKESILEIQDFAHSLLGEVQDNPHIRRSKTRIILIGHSMGGLVMKKAYVLARQKSLYDEFASRVKAMLFLATPHRGSDLARTLKNILRVVASGPKPFIDELDPNSSSIATINESFRQFAEDLHLRSFFETQPSKIGLSSALIVDKNSATLGFGGERFECLYADHRGVCKFDSTSDTNYKIVRNALSATIDVVTTQELSNDGDALQHCSSRLRTLTAISDMPEDDLMTLDDLRAGGSCEWFSSDPAFATWRDFSTKSSPIFWLSGNAASGKSVLASHVIRKLQTDGSTCSYFFFKDGATGRASVADCLRSLAYQMAMSDPASRTRMLELEKDDVFWDRDDERVVWRKLFQRCLLPLDDSQLHYWVIDGLDECNNGNSLFNFIGRAQQNLRVLVTSRKTPGLEHAFGLLKTALVHHHISVSDTAKDVKIYLDSMMDQLLVGLGDTREWLEESIMTKSAGSFLWVRLIVQELQTTYSEEAMESVLNEVPPDMNHVYARMLSSVIKSSRGLKIAKTILTWCVCAIRPLTVQELQHALKLDLNETVHGLERSINSICGHLVFIDHTSRVQMIHQTAKEYLVAQEDVPELRIDRRGSHSRISLLCTRFLSRYWFHEQKILNRRPPLASKRFSGSSRPTKSDDPALKTAFAAYACSFFSDHLYRSTSADPGPLEELCAFFEGNVLSWIEHAARLKDLSILTRAAKNLKAFLERRAKHYPSVSREVETVQLWTSDLIRVSAKFRSQLLSSPTSIHSFIPPICPTDSIIARMHSSRQRGLIVKGLDQNSWDDCLVRIDFQGAQTTAVAYGERYFAIGLSKGAVKIYDNGSIQIVNTLEHTERVKLLKFNNDDQYVLTAGLRVACLWSTVTGKMLWKRRTTHPVMSAMFVADGELLMLASKDNSLRTLRVADGEEIDTTNLVESIDTYETEQYPSQSPSLVAFSEEYNVLAVSRRGKQILLFDVDNRRLPLSFSRGGVGHISGTHYGVDAMAFNPSPELNVLIVSYGDGELTVFDLYTAEPRDQIQGVFAHSLACSPDGKTLVTGSSQGVLRIFDFAGAGGDKLSLMYQIDSYEHGIKSLAFSQDSLRFIDLRPSQCRVWEPPVLVRKGIDGGSFSELSLPVAATARRSSLLHTSTNPEIMVIKLNLDGRFCIAGKEDGTVTWYPTNGTESQGILYRHSTNTAIATLVVFQAEEDMKVISADESGRILVVEVSRAGQILKMARIVADIRTNESIEEILASPNTARFLVVGKTSHTVWSLDGTRLSELPALPSAAASQFPLNPDLVMFVDHRRVLLRALNRDEALYGDKEAKLGRVSDLELSEASNVVSLLASSTLITELRKEMSSRDLKRLSCWNAEDMTSSTLVTASPGYEIIGSKIEQLIAISDHSLFFLDTDLWVCSLDTRKFGATQQYRRHFFILSEWRSSSGSILIIMNRRDFILARKSDIIVIQRGLDFVETISLSPEKNSNKHVLFSTEKLVK